MGKSRSSINNNYNYNFHHVKVNGMLVGNELHKDNNVEEFSKIEPRFGGSWLNWDNNKILESIS